MSKNTDLAYVRSKLRHLAMVHGVTEVGISEDGGITTKELAGMRKKSFIPMKNLPPEYHIKIKENSHD